MQVVISAFLKIQVLTFLLDVRRFRYPERPVVFLSVCYFMVALAYVIGYAMGDSVSCNAPFDPPQDFSVDKADMVETITQVQYIKILKIATNSFSIFQFFNRERNVNLAQSSSCCSTILKWLPISGGSS